jgi:hypothetical protein
VEELMRLYVHRLSPHALLRVTAVVATLQAAAHVTLFLRSQPTPGSEIWPLVEAMRAQSAPGHTNYWAMYFGYGLLSAVTAFLIAALIWLASVFDDGSRRFARSLVGVIVIATVVHAIIIARYFFPVPLFIDIVVALLLAFSWAAMGKTEAA